MRIILQHLFNQASFSPLKGNPQIPFLLIHLKANRFFPSAICTNKNAIKPVIVDYLILAFDDSVEYDAHCEYIDFIGMAIVEHFWRNVVLCSSTFLDVVITPGLIFELKKCNWVKVSGVINVICKSIQELLYGGGGHSGSNELKQGW